MPRPARPKPDRIAARPGKLRVGMIGPGGKPLYADLYVDGARKGTTPTVVPGLRPGYHKVIAKLPGKPPVIRRVKIRSGRETALLLKAGK